MAASTKDKYYVRRTLSSGEWEDLSTKFQGLYILSLDGTNSIGDSVNIFTQQWVDSQQEDNFLAGSEVIRKNVDLTLTKVWRK